MNSIEPNTELYDSLLAAGLKVMNIGDSKLVRNVRGAMTDGANACLLYTSPSPRDRTRSRMPSSA